MDIKCKQIIYETEDMEKMFPLNKEGELVAIVLDSANLNNGKSFDSEDDKILNFINEQYNRGDKARYYDFIVTKKGTIYQTTPLTKAAKCLDFDLYSEEISKKLPKYCPQTDGKLFPRSITPDAAAISILIECDGDESTNIDNGDMSESSKESTEDLIAYGILKYGIKIRNVFERYRFPKLAEEARLSGPSFFRNHITGLIVLTSYALSISRNNSEGFEIAALGEPIKFTPTQL